MLNIKNQKAFSLMELSIVLIIIGLLVAGVTGGQSLMKSARLKGARMLTLGSPVPQIEDLILWLEPTLEGSFVDSSGVAVAYDSPVYEWRNKAGLGGYLPKAIQDTGSKQPTFIEEGINKLPTLRFDGSADTLTATTRHSLPAGTDDFTIFIVATTDSASNDGRLYGWATSGPTRKSPHLTLWGSLWLFSFRSDTLTVTSPIPVASTPTLLTWKFNGGRSYGYINGSATTPASDAVTPRTPSSSSFYIGSYNEGVHYWDGDISEIIMYDRALSDTERERVENYLMQKYKIR